MAHESTNLLDQIKRRRLALELTQQSMQERIGMTRQQYQRLEQSGNPRLLTLSLVAEGLNAELLLVPREKLQAVKDLLDERPPTPAPRADEDPWYGVLDEEADDN